MSGLLSLDARAGAHCGDELPTGKERHGVTGAGVPHTLLLPGLFLGLFKAALIASLIPCCCEASFSAPMSVLSPTVETSPSSITISKLSVRPQIERPWNAARTSATVRRDNRLEMMRTRLDTGGGANFHANSSVHGSSRRRSSTGIEIDGGGILLSSGGTPTRCNCSCCSNAACGELLGPTEYPGVNPRLDLKPSMPADDALDVGVPGCTLCACGGGC